MDFSEEGVPQVYTNIANYHIWYIIVEGYYASYYIWYIIVGEWGAARREYPASTITLPTIISGIF